MTLPGEVPVRRIVLAPHMDDESLGCGGLLAKYPADSLVVVVTDSGPQRDLEHANALAILGVRDSIRLGLPDGDLTGTAMGLVSSLDEILATYRPHELYLPFPSLHQDHIATYEAGLRAARTSMHSEHWYPPAVLVYDISAYDVDLYPSDLRWNVFESLSLDHVDKKVAACSAYVTEIPNGPHPMKSVREIASATGQVRLVEYAERYALVRMVRP